MQQPMKEKAGRIMGNSKRATIKTIAEEANVTSNTVSLALRDSPLVKKETKALILEIAARQGYVPNIMAESLRLGYSKLIALVFSDIGNPLFSIKTKKIEAALRSQGYQVMIMDTNNDLEQEKDVIRSAIGRKVDGVVLSPCQKGRDALDMLAQYKIPCVLVGRSFEDNLEDSVIWDNYSGGKLATEYLLSRGCRRILCLLGPKELSTTYERKYGYMAALKDAGIEADDELMCEADVEMVRAVIEKKQGLFDGVFAFNDPIAWNAAVCLESRVPIIGYDNVKSTISMPFSLPTIGADLDSETRYIVDLLLKRIGEFDRPTSKIVLPVEVVI